MKRSSVLLVFTMIFVGCAMPNKKISRKQKQQENQKAKVANAADKRSSRRESPEFEFPVAKPKKTEKKVAKKEKDPVRKIKDPVMEMPIAEKSAKKPKKETVAIENRIEKKIETAKSEPAKVEVPNGPSPLVLARNSYADGDYEKAIDYYESLSTDSPDYLRSREELAWSYLRANRLASLRGILQDLNTPLVPLRYRMEGRVLSAMLYLKDCQYQKVAEEVKSFQNDFRLLDKEITRQQASDGENTFLRSVKVEANEAILKMKFVRMELRSRLAMLSREQIEVPEESKAKVERVSAKAQTYPLDGDVWADEVFRGRGEGNSVCAQIHKEKAL